jgi:hypothetical protein
MEGLEVLLREVLDQHEEHYRPCDGFHNRFGIHPILLDRLDRGLDKLGRHQRHAVPMFAKGSRPIMSAPTGLHADHDWGNYTINGCRTCLVRRLLNTISPVSSMPTT